MEKIILASKSQARSALLQQVGIVFSTLSSAVDESQIKQSMQHCTPDEVVLRLAEAKAQAISTLHPEHYVIGGDQILVFKHMIFDKPSTVHEAKEHLLLLKGQSHALFSAQVVCKDGEVLWKNIQKVFLRMRHFSDDFLDHYLQYMGENVCDTVGGYKIEGLGAQLFAEIDGEYSTILGLPIFPLMDFLRTEKLLLD